MSTKFMIGVNYWDSVSGTEMWKNWNPEAVEKDLVSLKACGVQVLRVFPIWRDFQPIKKLYGCQASVGEIVLGDDEQDISKNEYCLDPVMMDRFKTFIKMCDKHGYKLVVAIVTGWMSGRLFVPPALEGLNLIEDPEALMWTSRFIRGFVGELKGFDNIIMWDLGNECNNLSVTNSRAAAYNWTSLVRSTILSVDNTREISSGMHGLVANDGSWPWYVKDQGELCDYVTTHPYPSPSIGANTEPYNGLRSSIMPTAQSEFYASLSGKPCIIQESGTFSQIMGNYDMGADWVNVNVLSALGNGYKGFLWWCGMDHSHIRKAPYSWINMERQLGIVDKYRNPRPAGLAMKKLSEVVDKLPQDLIKKSDAICVLAKDINKYTVAASSYILAKEAGFNVKFINEGEEVEKSDLYLMPCVAGWAVTHARTLDSILRNVKEGASFYVSNDGGHFCEFDEIFGLKSNGVSEDGRPHTVKFPFGDVNYNCTCEIYLESVGAEVLYRNEEGNPVLTKFKYGKGYVYYLNMPLENIAFNKVNGLNPLKSQPYYGIYRIFGEKVCNNYNFKTENPNVGITECEGSDGFTYIFAVNYNSVDADVDFIDKDAKYEVVYGDVKKIPACNGLILKLLK